jgi:regulator of replication initiation timing
MDHNVTDLNSRRGRRESVSDADIDAVIVQMMEANQGLLPSGEAVYEAVGSARTRCFARLKYWQRQGEAQRLENPNQLPGSVLDGLQLVMTRLEQDVQARMNDQFTEWELERIDLHSQIANARKRELEEIYRREDLEKQLAALEHRLVASQTENTRLWERNSELQRQVEQHKAQAEANQQIAEERAKELAASRSARSQLEQSVEQHRESYTRLQEEWRCLQEEQARLKAQYQDVVSSATTQQQLFDRLETMWYQRTQQYEATIESLRQQLKAEADENHARQEHVRQLQYKLDELPAIIEQRTESRVASLQSLVEDVKQQFQTWTLSSAQDAPRQAAYAKVMNAILDQAGISPEAFGEAQGAVERLRWQAGTNDDITAMIAVLQTLPGERIKNVCSGFQTVDTFMSHAAAITKR